MAFDRKTIRRRRNLLLSLVALVLFVGALAYASNWWVSGKFWVVTDNAFVTGNLIPMYSDATGIVAQVYYEETENVKKGRSAFPSRRAACHCGAWPGPRRVGARGAHGWRAFRGAPAGVPENSRASSFARQSTPRYRSLPTGAPERLGVETGTAKC